MRWKEDTVALGKLTFDFGSNSCCEAESLEYMYHVGLGSYAFKNCKAFDIHASIRAVRDSESQISYPAFYIKNGAKL